MNPEEKHMLERSLALAEENNTILLKMRRNAQVASFMRGLYWLVIIAVSLGAYIYIQPYVNNVLDLYNQAQSALTSVRGK